MNNNITNPAIYVACLAAYNNGILHGKWIDDLADKNSVWQEINNILSSSPIANAEEWAIHDYEGFGDIELGEYSGIDYACELASLIAEHGELFTQVYADVGCSQEAKRIIEEDYIGEYDTMEDYAREYLTECGDCPERWLIYFDYEKFCRDIALELRVYEFDSSVHLFHYT